MYKFFYFILGDRFPPGLVGLANDADVLAKVASTIKHKYNIIICIIYFIVIIE